MGGYAEYAFGKSGNFMANYTYGVSLLIANVAIAISAVGYGTELIGAELSPLGICLATIGVLWLCTVANFGGACITGKISEITVWGVIIHGTSYLVTSSTNSIFVTVDITAKLKDININRLILNNISNLFFIDEVHYVKALSRKYEYLLK